MKMRGLRKFVWVLGAVALVGAAMAGPALAQEDLAEQVAALEEQVAALYGGELENGYPSVDYLWTIIAATLVFLMHAGFACVESGFTRSKNTVNILMKNFVTIGLGILVFYYIGYGIMFGASNSFFGSNGFMLSHWGGEETPADLWAFVFFIFQAVFCATGATIVSGAVAERIKFGAYIAFVVVMTAIIYPVFGHWAWSGLWYADAETQGWLWNMGFLDFAGSSVVHSTGGWAALAGALILGARTGKYGRNGEVKILPGHSIPLAALGVFILWFGWIGFNAGSTTAATNATFSQITVTTMLAASAGTMTGMFTSWIILKKPDVSMTLNGALAGLVSITAPCDLASPGGAIAIGAIGGIIVVFACLFFEKVAKIDDPVGAISVHGVCGAWGTLSCALLTSEAYGGGFSLPQLWVQFVGVVACFLWAFITAGVFFFILKAIGQLRVSEEEEVEGLDYGEHGANAYPDFGASVFR